MQHLEREPAIPAMLRLALGNLSSPSDDSYLGFEVLEEDVRALVPPLCLYEVGNTIARRFSTYAFAWLESLIEFELEESPPSRQWLKAALELTDRYSVTFYDAAYHAIAIAHNDQFVTADTRYVSRANEAGAVVTLTDWMPP